MRTLESRLENPHTGGRRTDQGCGVLGWGGVGCSEWVGFVKLSASLEGQKVERPASFPDLR